ncbi:MAG: hypothetical protein K8U57_28970 [Planctomycetes bacterium]|nr:hypothetical protein [Planctomycetota bacterium]
MLNVHLRINDNSTKKPTPVRVRITSPDGTHHAPLGRVLEFPVGRNEAVGAGMNLDRTLWFPIDGACEIPLPAGVPLRIQATKGPEFTPLDEAVTLGTGQISLRFEITRWTDSHANGWMSVDSRCHFLTPHDALLEAAAEGVDVVNLLATVQRFPSINGTAYLTVPNLTAFSGQSPALERDGHAVIVNTLNTHPVLGSVGLLNSHRPVYPLTFGGEETDDWGICDWCDQCHRKGGLRVWVDAFEPTGGLVGGEALVAAILGKIDAIEVTAGPRKVPLMPWVYRLWNAGVLVPLVGGSGKDSNRVPLGSMRTYARVRELVLSPSPLGGGVGEGSSEEPNPPTPFPKKEGGARQSGGESSWIAAVRAGRCYATTGPLLDFNISELSIHATARSLFPFDETAIIANGKVIASVAGSETLSATLPESGWVTVRCHSATGTFAHTSPVAVGQPTRDPAAVVALRKLIDQTREWAEQHGRYVNPKRREQLLARCAEAFAKLGGDA